MVNNTNRAGFTLLEVLVALAIFSIIIVMMGNIYHQSAIAWDSGTRKAQGAIEARVILANIARELSHAVHLDEVGGQDALDFVGMDNQQFNHKSSGFTFVSLGWKRAIAEGASPFRDAHMITYVGDSTDGTLVRTESLVSLTADYSVEIDPKAFETVYVVSTNIMEITFTTPPEPADGSVLKQDLSEKLPRWVTIELLMGRLDDVSGVAAVSAGRNGVFESPTDADSDDIRTY